MSYQSQSGPLHSQPPQPTEEYAAPLPPPSSNESSPYGTVNSVRLPMPPKAHSHTRTTSSGNVSTRNRNSTYLVDGTTTTTSTPYPTDSMTERPLPALPTAAAASSSSPPLPMVVVVQQPTAQSAMVANNSSQESHIGASFGGGSGGTERRDALLAAGLATNDEGDDGAHGRIKNNVAGNEGWRPSGYDPYGSDAIARALAAEEEEEKRNNRSCCCCCCDTRGTDGVEASCCLCVLCCGLGQLIGFH
ncbi:hypothetical protein BDF22DRAFT_745980 [Syncephalis plumigaleata]|nr:hypothetical protein BDF22DRAFT_745980 [Syncephalis plumigaleata]